MARYDYACLGCKHRFEEQRPVALRELTACPVCGKPALRQATAPAFHLKGRGFHVNDYPKGPKP